MFSLHTFASLARQMARLVPAPSDRSHRPTRAAATSEDGCGLCPHCGEFVFIRFDDEGPAACPRCDRPVDELEPLGPG